MNEYIYVMNSERGRSKVDSDDQSKITSLGNSITASDFHFQDQLDYVQINISSFFTIQTHDDYELITIPTRKPSPDTL
jgi:hypothetical protein